MSTIKFFALGGLGEDGKNMYCLDIANQLYVLDAGLKYPTTELFGVDAVLPDFKYLIEQKHRLKGLFLSHGHEDHIGAVPKLLKEVNVPVYGSFFTLELLKDQMKDQGLDVKDFTLHEVKKEDELKFKELEVSFYQTTHSIPGSLGMAFNTKDGVIVYSPDYTFDQNVEPAYKTSFERLAAIAGKNVLALLTESLGSEQMGYSHTGRQLDHQLNQAFFKAKKRVIVSTFSTDIFRIQKVVNIALKYDRRIAIIGRKAQRMVDIALNLGVLKIPEDKLATLRFIDEKNKNELEDGLVLVTGDRHEPFHMMQRMVRKIDRLVHVNETDTVILMTPPIPGTERIAARTLDVLYRHNVNVVKIDKHSLPMAHASSEDIKLLINILRPKYLVPVIGEHRHFFAMKNIAKSQGYAPEDVKVLDNGQVLEFKDGQALEVKQSIQSGDVLVDGILDGDLSDVVLRDREVLSQDGVILVIGHVDARKRKHAAQVEVVSRGFVYIKENEEIIAKIGDLYNAIAEELFKGPYIDWRVFKEKVREDVGKYVFRTTNRKPIIIPVLIDVQKDGK